MSSYVESGLMDGERVEHQARLHWIVLARPCFATAFGVALVTAGLVVADGAVGGPLLLVGGAAAILGLAGLLAAWIRRVTTELAVTNRRVIAKFGFIARSTYEISLRRVEGAHVEQSVLGRLLGFGTVFVKGTGGGSSPIVLVEDPMAFRLAVAEAVERTEND